MTDSNEKGSIDRSDIARQDPEGQEPHYERPTGLKGLYYSTVTQTAMVGFVCFMCPGMFNALSGLGGGGKSDPKLADDMVCLFLLIPTIVVILHLLSSPPGDNCFSHD